VLNSTAATAMSVHVVRAFIRLREMVISHKAIAAKLAELDARVGNHDEQLAAIIDTIRQMTRSAAAHDRKIGFHRGNR
jgi:hypothetical protein